MEMLTGRSFEVFWGSLRSQAKGTIGTGLFFALVQHGIHLPQCVGCLCVWGFPCSFLCLV